jgi:hypothetical protein
MICLVLQRRQIHRDRREDPPAGRCHHGLHNRAPAEEAAHGRRPVPLAPRTDEVHQAGDPRRSDLLQLRP